MTKFAVAPVRRGDQNNNSNPSPGRYNPITPKGGKTTTIGSKSRVCVLKRLNRPRSQIPIPCKPKSDEQVELIRTLMEKNLKLEEKLESKDAKIVAQQVEIVDLKKQLAVYAANTEGGQLKHKAPASKKAKAGKWGLEATKIVHHYFEKRTDQKGVKFYFCKICFEVVGRCFHKVEKLNNMWLWTDTAHFSSRTKAHLKYHPDVFQQIKNQEVLDEEEQAECFEKCVAELKELYPELTAGCPTVVSKRKKGRRPRPVVTFDKMEQVETKVEKVEELDVADKEQNGDEDVE